MSIRMVRRGGGDTGSGPTIATMDISLGSVLTDSGTADGEVQALNDRMFLAIATGWTSGSRCTSAVYMNK